MASEPQGRQGCRSREGGATPIRCVGHHATGVGCLVVGLLLVVVRNVLVHAVWELQILINMAGVRVVRVRADGGLLLLLPLQNTFAPWWIVVPPVHLMIQGTRLLRHEVGVLLQDGKYFPLVHEVPGDHGKHQPPVMANILTGPLMSFGLGGHLHQ
jgi:hypothetical protein